MSQEDKKDLNFQVKVAPEFYKKLNTMIDKVQKESNFEKKGQALELIADMAQTQLYKIAPDFQEAVSAIEDNLSAIRARVISMNDQYITYQKDEEQRAQKEQNVLFDQIKEAGEKNQNLQSALDKKEEEISKLEPEIERLTNENLGLNARISRYEKEEHSIAELATQIQGTQKNYETEVESNRKLQERTESLQEQLYQSQAALKELEHSLEKNESELIRLREQSKKNEQLMEDNIVLEKELSNRIQQVESLEENLKEVIEQSERINTENRDFQKLLTDRDNKLHALENEKNILEEKLSNCMQQIKSLKEQYEQQIQLFKRPYEQQVEALTSRLTEIRVDYENIRGENKRLISGILKTETVQELEEIEN